MPETTTTNQSAIETAVLADDLTTLDKLLATPADARPAVPLPLPALMFSALKSRPLSFQHILQTHPNLQAELNNRSLLLKAIDGGVPIWNVILEHRPEAKNQRFGHYGTVVERCVMDGEEELLTFLLEKGARVEREGGIPVLRRAELCGASENIKAVLRKHGARTEWRDSEDEDGEDDED